MATRHGAHTIRTGNGAAQVEGAGIVGGTTSRAASRSIAISYQPGRLVRPIAHPGAGAVGRSTVTSGLPDNDRFKQCTQVQNVFALLGRGCVAFYPRLADLSASVTAALLLGQCLYWTRTVLRQHPDRNGWVWKTSAAWGRETGLTRREQDSARRRLRALGLLAEQRRGMPAKRWFRLDLEALGRHLGRAPGGSSDRWVWDDTDLNRTLGQPVVYWRRLHDLTGSVSAALYLSRALFWQRLALQKPQHHGAWFHRPIFQSQQMLR